MNTYHKHRETIFELLLTNIHASETKILYFCVFWFLEEGGGSNFHMQISSPKGITVIHPFCPQSLSLMNFNYTSNLSKFQLHLIFKEFAAQVKFENEETKKKSN